MEPSARTWAARLERSVEASPDPLRTSDMTVRGSDDSVRGHRVSAKLARFGAERHPMREPQDSTTGYQDLWSGPTPARQTNPPPFVIALVVAFMDTITQWLMGMRNGLKAWVSFSLFSSQTTSKCAKLVQVARKYPPFVDPRASVRFYSEPPIRLTRTYDSEGSKPGHDDEVAGEQTRPAASSSRQTWEGKNKTIEIPGYQSALERHEAELQHRARKLDGTIQPVGSSSGSSMHLVTSPSSLKPGQTGLPSPHSPDHPRSVPRSLSPMSISDKAMEPVRASISSLIERTLIASEDNGRQKHVLRTLDGEGRQNAEITLELGDGDVVAEESAHNHDTSGPTSSSDMHGKDKQQTPTVARQPRKKGGRGKTSTQVPSASKPLAKKDDPDATSIPAHLPQHDKRSEKKHSKKSKPAATAKHDPSSPSTSRSTRRSKRITAAASPTSAPAPEPAANGRRTRRRAKKKGKETGAGQLGVDPDA
ncbi:hypothetical protein HBI84_211080 [Parastagonospora nodorum]|nr:hypothetical protein HBI84_211080 [Parastagonospora nodorum]